MANAKNYQLLEVNSPLRPKQRLNKPIFLRFVVLTTNLSSPPDSNPMAAFQEEIARINAAYDVHIARYWETRKNVGLTIDSSVLGQSATQNSISHTDVLCCDAVGVSRYSHYPSRIARYLCALLLCLPGVRCFPGNIVLAQKGRHHSRTKGETQRAPCWKNRNMGLKTNGQYKIQVLQNRRLKCRQ